jgi:hypothetical protein
MPVLPCVRPSDPLRLAVGQCGAPVEARGNLHAHPGPPARDAGHEPYVQLARFGLKQPRLEPDTGGFQFLAAAGTLGVRIAHRGDYARDLCTDECICTRRGPPEVAAGLERHIDRRTGRLIARGFQRNRLGVRLARLLVPAFPDYLPAFDDEAPDAGIRRGRVQPSLSQLERPRHVTAIFVAKR